MVEAWSSWLCTTGVLILAVALVALSRTFARRWESFRRARFALRAGAVGWAVAHLVAVLKTLVAFLGWNSLRRLGAPTMPDDAALAVQGILMPALCGWLFLAGCLLAAGAASPGARGARAVLPGIAATFLGLALALPSGLSLFFGKGTLVPDAASHAARAARVALPGTLPTLDLVVEACLPAGALLAAWSLVQALQGSRSSEARRRLCFSAGAFSAVAGALHLVLAALFAVQREALADLAAHTSLRRLLPDVLRDAILGSWGAVAAISLGLLALVAWAVAGRGVGGEGKGLDAGGPA